MQTYFGQTDAPVNNANEEYLGISHYVEALSKFILVCQTPLTISIQGDWGTGKTSMMNLVRENLQKGEGGDKVATFWFNTWQFSQFSMQDDIAISLLSNLLDQLTDNPSTKKLLAAIPRKAVGYVGQVGRAALDIAIGGGGDAFKESLENVSEKLLGNESDPARQITKIKDAFTDAVNKQLIKESAARLVIFVDDLDRLVPEKAVELLEVIKLFLDVKHCVFVLAVDYHVVALGLEKKFGFSIDDPKGKSFFDKIIQLPFNLPISQYNTSAYLKRLLEQYAKIDHNELELYVRLATLSIGSNPRSLKRLFNALQLLQIVAESRVIMTEDTLATATERYRILFAVMCLQLAYPLVYESIIKQRHTLDDQFLRGWFNRETLLEGHSANVIKKTLGNDVEEESLDLFTRFMQAFYEALQLQSDNSEGGDETLVQAELDVLLSFLSFSSLTVSSGEAQPMDEQSFRHKPAITQFLHEALAPKYQTLLESIHSELKCWFRGENGGIDFEFKAGAMNFKFCVSWWGDSGISVSLDDLGIAANAKHYAIEWFQQALKETFPTPDINKRKSYDYMTLQKHPFGQATEAAKLEAFKNVTDQVLTAVLPKLAEFYASRQIIIQQLQGATGRLAQKLSLVFPSDEGWIIENNLKNLCQYDNLKIYKASWANKLALCIEQDSHYLNRLFFGIHKLNRDRQYDEALQEQVLSACRALFVDGKFSSWWCFYTYAKEGYKNFTKGAFITDLHYAFSTPEQENAAIDYFVEQLGKFRQIETQLDDLAASATARANQIC